MKQFTTQRRHTSGIIRSMNHAIALDHIK